MAKGCFLPGAVKGGLEFQSKTCPVLNFWARKMTNKVYKLKF